MRLLKKFGCLTLVASLLASGAMAETEIQPNEFYGETEGPITIDSSISYASKWSNTKARLKLGSVVGIIGGAIVTSASAGAGGGLLIAAVSGNKGEKNLSELTKSVAKASISTHMYSYDREFWADGKWFPKKQVYEYWSIKVLDELQTPNSKFNEHCLGEDGQIKEKWFRFDFVAIKKENQKYDIYTVVIDRIDPTGYDHTPFFGPDKLIGEAEIIQDDLFIYLEQSAKYPDTPKENRVSRKYKCELKSPKSLHFKRALKIP